MEKKTRSVKTAGSKVKVLVKKQVSREALHQLIVTKAQQVHDRRGCGAGDALSDWLEAERQVLAEYTA